MNCWESKVGGPAPRHPYRQVILVRKGHAPETLVRGGASARATQIRRSAHLVSVSCVHAPLCNKFTLLSVTSLRASL